MEVTYASGEDAWQPKLPDEPDAVDEDELRKIRLESAEDEY